MKYRSDVDGLRAVAILPVCGTGLALVLLAVFAFTPDTPLPLIMLVSCTGTAMIIHSSENGPSIAGRLLSWRPAVFVGLISYSLYLWHWPIMVFQRSDHFLADQAPLATKFELIAVSIGVAYLSWRFIDAVVFGPTVEYDYALPRLLADAIRYHDPQLADRERTAAVPLLDRRMRMLVTGKGIPYVSTYDEMCKGGTCAKLVDGDVPYQFDAGHLTAAGSIALAEKLRDDHALP